MVWSGPQLQEWAAEPAAYLTDQRPGGRRIQCELTERAPSRQGDTFCGHRGVRDQGLVILIDCQRRPAIVCGAPAAEEATTPELAGGSANGRGPV